MKSIGIFLLSAVVVLAIAVISTWLGMEFPDVTDLSVRLLITYILAKDVTNE